MVKLRRTEGDAIAERVYAACSGRSGSEPPRRYLGMSQIGRPCARRLWLDLRAPSGRAPDGRLARVFDMGHSVEARVIADLRLVYKVDGEQRGFSDFGGRFRGHCDGIIRGVTSRPHVLEIKSANDASFKRFRELGIGARAEYAAQVQCYMGYAGLERALFVVENKNDQSLLVRRVRFDAEAFAALRDKAWGILEAKAPPAADRSDCRWCDHEGAACASVDAGSPACCTCAWFLPWEELRKAGALTGGDVCCLRRAPASWLGRCERYQQTA